MVYVIHLFWKELGNWDIDVTTCMFQHINVFFVLLNIEHVAIGLLNTKDEEKF